MEVNVSPVVSLYRIISFNQVKRLYTHGFWWLWLITLVISSSILIINLEYAPSLFMDEFMNVDLGRTILHNDTDWSIAWMTKENRPVFLITYLGPVLQELSYLLLGELGPRLSALLGALIAATLMLNWLIVRGTSRIAAFILSLSFLLDPIFVQAYTTGRVDGWAIAFCLLSCWVIRYTARYNLTENKEKWHLFIGGVSFIIASFLWASAIFLIPLIFLELSFFIRKKLSNTNTWVSIVITFAPFIIGGLLTSFLLILPIASQFLLLFNNIVEALLINTRHGGDISHQNSLIQNITPFIDVLRNLKFSPVLSLLAIIGLVRKQELGLILAITIVVVLMMSTIVYICRVLYLMPYLVASASIMYPSKCNNTILSTSNYRYKGVILVLIWSIGLTLFVRTGLALYKQEERDRSLVNRTATSMIKAKNPKVALFNASEFYYAGRSLGWKMYSPYKPAFEELSEEKMQKTLSQVEFAIIPAEQLSAKYINVLLKEGMYDKGTYTFYKDPILKDYLKDYSKTTNLNRLQNLYKIERQPYGPYKLYARLDIQASVTMN